jgi:hypothetical protein
MTPPDLAFAVAVLLLAYFVRGISGFGSGLIAVPLLALRFPLPEVVPFMLIADFGASALVGGIGLGQVDWREIRRLLPAMLLGVVLGTHLLVSLPPAMLLTVLGLLAIVFAVRSLLLRQTGFTATSKHWAYPAALAGGAVSGLFGTGGPPYVIYFSHRIRDKSEIRATFSGLFLLDGGLRIATFLATGLLLQPGLWLALVGALPVMAAGLYLGHKVHLGISNAQMLKLIGGLLLGSGASLLWTAWG